MPTSFTIEGIGASVGLGTSDLKVTTVNVIQWALGILALLAVAGLIIGAADWLISGDSDVVKTRARRIMLGSLAGLIVILLAWAIVHFVIGTTGNVTQ